MGPLSIWHIIIILLFVFLIAFPISKILNRMGFNGWWTVIGFIPLVSIVGLWVLANKEWPAFSKSTD